MTNHASEVETLAGHITNQIRMTNGLSLDQSLALMRASSIGQTDPRSAHLVADFHEQLQQFQIGKVAIQKLIDHPFAAALGMFFKAFPLPYCEEHIHLTGSLSSDFVFPRLQALIAKGHGERLKQKVTAIYGPDSWPIESPADIDRLLTLKPEERFDRYLKILMLPKLVLIDREAHRDAAYHLANELYTNYNVGKIRLKFTLSRATSDSSEQVPGLDALTSEDIALGLYEGFTAFRSEHPEFEFILSPCFRKEADFFDSARFPDKPTDVLHQVQTILDLLDRYPFLQPHLREVDTVGNERGFFRKSHFNDLRIGFRKLQYRGFQIRSHHGETWNILRHGIQAVDNAMNIWHINTLEHGLSLGINPNYYYHRIYQRSLRWNEQGLAIRPHQMEHHELLDMQWNGNDAVCQKLLNGEKLNASERILFTKAKFHTALEVEHYQHDVLNRMIHKRVSLIALPSSNYKLTACFEDYKQHPFSWWEKKAVKLGVGTDNYITLETNFIKEMLILMFTDPVGLKITKLLMITSGETRRPYISNLLWKMRVNG